VIAGCGTVAEKEKKNTSCSLFWKPKKKMCQDCIAKKIRGRAMGNWTETMLETKLFGWTEYKPNNGT